MKKIFLIFSIILILSSCSQNLKININETTKTEIIKIGFCPTMKEESVKMKEKNKNIKLIQFSSSNEVLQNLKLKKIDAALIGRKADKKEIDSKIFEKKLEKEKKYTLITNEKRTILEKKLNNIEIKTCLDKSIQEKFSELKLKFLEKCDYSDGKTWLISWNDYSDEQSLLIPINELGEKIKKFRSAHLYTTKNINLKY